MATRPTWNTKVLDSINRMMIRFRRMAVSWILCERRENVCELQTQNIVPAEVFVCFLVFRWVLGTFLTADSHEKYQLDSRFGHQQLTEGVNEQVEQQEAELDQ